MAPTKSVLTRVYFGLFILLLVAGVFFIFYLSWLPDPMLSKYDLLPNWLTRWTDAPKNDAIRTAVPFVGLGLVTGGYLWATDRNWCWWLSGWIGLTLIVLIAEAGQLTLPYRSFDWDDVAWGTVGSAGGLSLTGSVCIIARLVAQKIRRNNHTPLKKNGS